MIWKKNQLLGAKRKKLEAVVRKCESKDVIFVLQSEDRSQPCLYVWQEISGEKCRWKKLGVAGSEWQWAACRGPGQRYKRDSILSEKWFSKCGSSDSIIRVAWELIRIAHSEADLDPQSEKLWPFSSSVCLGKSSKEFWCMFQIWVLLFGASVYPYYSCMLEISRGAHLGPNERPTDISPF